MVTILPPKTNGGDLIGSALGRGLTQGMQQQYERKRIQNALGELEGIENQKLSPTQLTTRFLKATAGLPGVKTDLAQILPYILQTSQNQQGSTPEVQQLLEDYQNKTTGPNLPGFLQQQGAQHQQTGTPEGFPQPTISHEDYVLQQANRLGESYFPNIQPPEQGQYSYKPQAPLQKPKPISPAEKKSVRRNLANQGVTDPAEQNQIIQDLVDYQTQNYDAQKEGFTNYENFQKAQQVEDTRFFDSIGQQLGALHPDMPPEKQNIWKGLSRLAENQGPDEARFRQTEQMYDNLVENPLRSFNENVQDLPYASILRPGLVNERIENARSQVQDHLRLVDESGLPPQLTSEIKNNLRDSYFTSMVSKDYGTAQAANAIYDLSSKYKSGFPKAPPHREEDIRGRHRRENPEKRAASVEKLADHLFKTLQQDDSLVLAREWAIHNGYDDAAFNQALRQMQAKGKKLSTFQINERPKLDLPYRLDLDSIMGGKRSSFDLFKGKH